MLYLELKEFTDEKTGNPFYLHFLAFWAKFDTFFFKYFAQKQTIN